MTLFLCDCRTLELNKLYNVNKSHRRNQNELEMRSELAGLRKHPVQKSYFLKITRPIQFEISCSLAIADLF